MPKQLTAEDGRQSLQAHAAAKGAEIREKYGPEIGWLQLLQLLEDRVITRYPCEIVFDDSNLQPGEFAYPRPKSEDPAAGFTLFVHPHFRHQLDRVPWLVLYHLVMVNYGEFATADDAEAFASSALGLPPDRYYQALCAMADEIPGATPAPSPCSCGSTGCH